MASRADSRANHPSKFFKSDRLNPATLAKVRALKELALTRGVTLAQFAIPWVLRRPEVTTVLVGASRRRKSRISPGDCCSPL